MRKIFVVLTALTVLSMLLVACGGAATTVAPVATAAPDVQPTAKPGAVDVRWFVGMGTGTDPVQVRAELEVVNQFNAKQDAINLILEIVPFDSAKDVLSTQIASGNGPDIIGPVGWGGSNAFYGQWLDISQYMTSSGFDSSIFNPALVSAYETSEGQVGLPFAVYPSVVFFNTKLFDEAGLNYPPATYGEKYKMPDGTEVDWSWDTLTAVAKLLTIDGAGKNSTEADFNKDDVKQYGYTWQYENHPNYWGAFFANGSMLAADGKTAQAPDAWKAAWKWTYDAIWGAEPFMANGAVEGSQDYAGGNPFNSGKVAMTDQPFWYTCCMGDLTPESKGGWEAGILPSYNGTVSGRVDADTFRVWKGTKNPEQAFEVLKYLVTDAVDILIIGSKDMKAAYGAIPALISAQEAWTAEKAAAYPWVKNLDTVIAGLSYPDAPSAEGYMPNYNEAWTRGSTFANLLRNTAGLDLDAEIATYLADLDVIFAK